MSTRTTCPYCGVGCGVVVQPPAADGGGGNVRGDSEHPANQGRLCSKGAALGETFALPDRLLYPEVGGKRASWEAALDAVAEGFSKALRVGGPDNIGFYVSGQLLTEDYYAVNKLAKGFLGTANIDSNSRLCMASAVAAHKRAFGEDLVPGVYADLEQADLLVLVGSNLAWCHPVLHQRVLAAQAARPEMRVVVVDPRRTATMEGASLHLPLRPGSDVALFAGLLAYLAENQKLNPALPGLAEAVATAQQLASQVAQLTGLAPTLLTEFYRAFASTERTVTLWSQGVNQSSAGADKANAIVNVHIATGRIGRAGMGPFSITGQPNAMGGREVGALANTLAAHLEWNRAGDAEAVARFWQAPSMARGPGLTAVPLFQALGAGQLGALWVMATNPAVSLPDGHAVRKALADAPFLVVSDCSRASDTLAYAHVRLPALGWGEKDGTVTNSERVISRQRSFLPVPGAARADWWMVAQVAQRLGFQHGFGWQRPAQIFREHAALSAVAAARGRVFDLTGLAQLSDAAYDAFRPTRWPVSAASVVAAEQQSPKDGRIVPPEQRLIPTAFRAPLLQPDTGHQAVMLTGRLRDQWHTMTRTGFVPRLMAGQPEPSITLHPEDAPVAEGMLVAVEGMAPGEDETALPAPAILRLALDAGQARGTAFLPMHWTTRFAHQGRSNGLMAAALDPISQQPELKHAPVRISPWPARWYGFALAVGEVALAETYQAGAPMPHDVWRYELAGQDAPQEAAARLRASLEQHAARGHWRRLDDAGVGQHRAVLLAQGMVLAAVFLAAAPAQLPMREWLGSLIGRPDGARAARRALLAGMLPDGLPASRTICACNGVTEAVIRQAIAAGAESVSAIGAACAAGTGCGACRPELAGLLAQRATSASTTAAAAA